MGAERPPKGGRGGHRSFLLILLLFLSLLGNSLQLDLDYGCPPQEKILPCRCSTRDMEFQIWCSHSELPKVLEGLKAVGQYVSHPIDELILENNNLPSLPGQVFASLRVLRLMLRNNRLERVSSGWLQGLQDSLLELFLVEPELRSLPVDTLENLQSLEAITIQSRDMKRLPKFSGLTKLRYLQINSPSLIELAPRSFQDLPNLEQFHVFGSPKLVRLEAGLLRDMQRLVLVNISDCGIQMIHPRAMINLPELKEISLVGNGILDAGMVGRAALDLVSLTVIRLDHNRIPRLSEASFIDLPTLSRLFLSNNLITEIAAGALQKLPMLRSIDLNHNRIHRIHPEFFPQRSGLEEIWLIDNDLNHVNELRSVLEALPRLKLLDASYNQLEEIPFGALRGHSTLERLHLDHNRLGFLQRETFTAMPALRELRLRNNSLSNALEAPFWNLPALKGLDLSENYFRYVEPRLFENLPNLRRLDLSGNAIGIIEPESFIACPALEHINISGNALSVVHPMTFRHLANLYELDLSWNRLLDILPGLPRNVEHLHLHMNRITALPAGVPELLALPLLRSLDLSVNGLERILPGSFIQLPNLRKLNLGFNALRLIEEGTFDGLSRLEQLDLRYNRLATLHGRSFKPLRSLMDLSLLGNRLEVIRPDIFQENSKLQRADFGKNNLAQIPHPTFANTRNLEELHASHNTLTELPASLHGLTTLQVLDLSYNKLNVLSADILSSLTSLLELKLVRNRIRELGEGAFDRMPRMSLIDLENNDLRVIEQKAFAYLPELQVLRLGKNKLQLIPTGAFTDLPFLREAQLQENRIQEIAPNAFQNVPNLLLLNLSQNALSTIEYAGLDSLTSLEVLDISNNRLSKVSSDSLSSMEWLVELKMDNNRICTIQDSPFDNMPRLRVLSLRNNRMASVLENSFKRLRSNIAVFDIDGNPLSCSCRMLWLRGWLQQSSTEGPRCADGSLLREVRLSRQDCQRERQIEPVHPGCEAEYVNEPQSPASSSLDDMSALWMNMKNPDNRLPPNAQDSIDYLYDDYDYPYDNNGTTIANSTNLVQVTTAIGTPSNFIQGPSTNPTTNKLTERNSTSHQRPAIPASPSSSGFTFFGLPLPNLNFNLWGNAGKKSDRKDEVARPGRSRHRAFPPTEPEIQHGGFQPLPRAQGGFTPIPDPRLKDRKPVEANDTFKASEGKLLWKGSNVTITKIEKPSPSTVKTRTKIPKEREELSTTGIGNVLQTPQAIPEFSTTSLADVTSTSPNMAIATPQDSALEEDSDDDFATHTFKEETDEYPDISAKVTESATTSSTSSTDSDATDEEIKFIPKRTKLWNVGESSRSNKDSTTEASYNSQVPELEEDDNEDISEDEDLEEESAQAVLTTTPVSEKTQQKTKHTEASALSALLVPGGLLPASVPSTGMRQMGRPTITRVSSPHLSTSATHKPRPDKETSTAKMNSSSTDNLNTERFMKMDNVETPGNPISESVRATEDSAFNWYFQHYNDTNNLEPYVGVVYNTGSYSKVDNVSTSFYVVLFILFNTLV